MITYNQPTVFSNSHANKQRDITTVYIAGHGLAGVWGTQSSRACTLVQLYGVLLSLPFVLQWDSKQKNLVT
ncbi:hypothetical protein SUGI_0911590 [Cryptomeria japonica]|nr:hypothetical protein SUGI_0911590 [Cryptomeria japonica]